MAEALLQSLDSNLQVNSAGTKPASHVHPLAIRVMKEINIDLSNHFPKNVDRFLNESFDYVITVCDNAKESCPVFLGRVTHRLHIGFPDPAEATGTPEEILAEFRQVRNMIRTAFTLLYNETITTT